MITKFRWLTLCCTVWTTATWRVAACATSSPPCTASARSATAPTAGASPSDHDPDPWPCTNCEDPSVRYQHPIPDHQLLSNLWHQLTHESLHLDIIWFNSIRLDSISTEYRGTFGRNHRLLLLTGRQESGVVFEHGESSFLLAGPSWFFILT